MQLTAREEQNGISTSPCVWDMAVQLMFVLAGATNSISKTIPDNIRYQVQLPVGSRRNGVRYGEVENGTRLVVHRILFKMLNRVYVAILRHGDLTSGVYLIGKESITGEAGFF